jgi:FMN-dependent NADH-azoreductase
LSPIAKGYPNNISCANWLSEAGASRYTIAHFDPFGIYMANLLYVEASPRKQRSASIEVAQAFLDSYRDSHPGHTVHKMDVWNLALPEFDGAAIDAKYAGIEGRERTEEQKKVWQSIQALAQPFKDADTIVISAPMWNWGIPYKLKHLIDVVSQKDILFTFDERGLLGLLNGKKAVLILAKGVDYAPESATRDWDVQTSYLTVWLNSNGITDITLIPVEKTLYGPEVDQGSRDAAKIKAISVARSLPQ